MTNPPNKDKQSTLLKETRQAKGITLEMVHEATKIPLDALKAIEQGYSVHKLQTFYYRGFIKIYTKYLELDETQILQEYGLIETAAPKPQSSAVKESKKTQSALPVGTGLKNAVRPMLKNNFWASPVGRLVLVVVVILVALFLFKPKPSQKKSATSTKPIVKSEVKTPVRSAVKPKVKESAVREDKRDVAVKPVSASVQETPVNPKSEIVKSENSEEKSEKKSKPIELTVRATKSGWLQVKADGQVIFQSTLKKGDAESWKADTEIELSGRNINLLEFELNGKMLGALGASDRGAKKVVFTKDGLSVKK